MSLKTAKILVIYGGRCAEREVSLQSGSLVLAALKERGYQATGLDLYGTDLSLNPVEQLQAENFDLAFIALHGGEGEDGRVQALLELMGKPYTGSSPLACGFAMDKVLSKKYWLGIGIPTPAYLAFSSPQLSDLDVIESELPYPLIVKPSREGSTIGINKAENREQLESALASASVYDSEVLVEQYIAGPEFTVTIIDDVAYPVIGLKASDAHELYDYEAKYIANDTQYLLPSGLDEDDELYVQKIALDAYQSLGCAGWGRVDVMQDAVGEFWVLEVNTSPGMTSHSLVPMSAAHVDISYAALVERIATIAWSEFSAGEAR